MSRLTIFSDQRTYIVSPDDSVPPEARLCAFVAGQARDDVTKQPLSATVEITVEEPGFTVDVKDDNWFVIAGLLRWQFPLLSMGPSDLHLHLSALGYVSKAVTATVPQTPAGQLPAVVVLPSADTEMHRQP